MLLEAPVEGSEVGSVSPGGPQDPFMLTWEVLPSEPPEEVAQQLRVLFASHW